METNKTEINLNSKPDSKWGKIKKVLSSYGPGIITVLTWLGAGDLIDSSVAGSHFGYALMWTLVLANLIRFTIVNLMARFELCNLEGITLMERFSRLNKIYPMFLTVATVIMAHMTNAYMIKGTGEVLFWIFKIGSPLLWSVIIVAVSFFILGRDVYNKLEYVMKILLAIMTICFIGLAIYTKPEVGGIVKGIFGFAVPANKGIYDTILVIMGLVGAVAGSLGNFFYLDFIRDKGWTKPEDKKHQRNDLLFAVCMGAVLVLGIWVVGAQILKPNNIEVKSLGDIAAALEMYLGPVGSIIFYLGAFGALYSSVIGHAVAYPKLTVQNYNILKKGRKEKYTDMNTDPLYRKLSLFVLVSPIIWSIPGMPGFITLTLTVNAFNVIILPSISIGLLIISNQKKYMGKYTNNILENVVLSATTVLAVYSGFKLLMSFFS